MNQADTAWMLIATALVLLMTPALAFFYGGLVRSRNALNTMMMSFISLGFVGVAWALVGYSLALSPADGLEYLARTLHEQGASPYVFCVNIDAVIAALLLALLWPDYQAGRLTDRDLETAAFTVFLYGRMIGSAAEIDDHMNRGRNMDTRTPASACGFVV